MQHAFSVFNSNTQQLQHYTAPVPLEEGEDRPFGITWDQDNLYIATPRRILVFDKHFKYQRTLLDNLTPGIHQILLYDERLWMVSPRLNCVKIYSFKDGSMKYFLPEEQIVQTTKPKQKPIPGRTKYIYDLHHFNSILIKKDKLYISAHNFDKPSYVMVFGYPDLKLKYRIRLGKKIHCIGDDDAMYVCDSSGSRCVISDRGHKIAMGADSKDFLRGMVITSSHICATHFPFQVERAERHNGNSYLTVLDRSNSQRVQYPLKNVGNVNDLRVLDEYDFAHGIGVFCIDKSKKEG